METLITFLDLMCDLIKGVLRLNPDVFQAALDSSITGIFALVILFFAGLSDTIGHSVVFFANRNEFGVIGFLQLRKNMMPHKPGGTGNEYSFEL